MGLHGVVKFGLKVLQMKRILGLLVLISGLAVGQEMDTIRIDSAIVDSTKLIPANKVGIYLVLAGKAAPNLSRLNVTEFYGGGVQYNKWSLGFMIREFVGGTKRYLIFPNLFSLNYRYGGPILSFNFYESRWVDLFAQTSFASGDMVWRNTSTKEDFLRDKFFMSMLSVKVETGRFRYVRPFLNVGYQQMTGLELSGVNQNQFSGFFFGGGLRLGYFNQ